MTKEVLEIYVDGSVAGKNGGAGGRFIYTDSNGIEVLHEFSTDGYFNPTSTKMEVLACLHALIELQKINIPKLIRRITIFTDAKYVADNYKEAMFHWIGHAWKMKSGKSAPDREEWRRLIKQILRYKKEFNIFVEILWKKGHSQNLHNNAAHLLAKKAALSPLPCAPKRKIVSRKNTW